MNKNEIKLRTIIREELKKQLNEEDYKWVIPFQIKWKPEAAGLYRVLIHSENGKKLEVDTVLSDSMPNDISKLNKMLIKLIEEVKKMGNKN